MNQAPMYTWYTVSCTHSHWSTDIMTDMAADLDSQEVHIIHAGQDELEDDFRIEYGLSTPCEVDESIDISCVGMDEHFGIKQEHYENLPKDSIGVKAPEDSVEKLVEHLVVQMTGIDVKDINHILKTNVPEAVNKEVSGLLGSLEPLLLKAWEVTKNHTELKNVERTEQTNVDATDSSKDEPAAESISHSDHVIPISFYQYLRKRMNEDSGCRVSTRPPALKYLYDICNMSGTEVNTLDSIKYHTAWKGFIGALLTALVYKPDGTRPTPTEHEVVNCENGSGEVGFQVACKARNSTRYCPILHCEPDALLIMEGNLNLANVQSDLHRLCIFLPALAVEIQTSCAETASYNAQNIRDDVSPFTSGLSSSNSLMDVDCSLTEASKMSPGMVLRCTSGTSSSSSQPNTPGGESVGGGHRKRHVPVTSGGVSILVKKQMAKMKKKHVVQLIGMYKWTISIIEKALSKINQVEGLANYKLKTRNLGSLGLFVMQNRVYFTRLSIPNLSESDPARSPSIVVLNWAMQRRLSAKVNSSYPATIGCPPKMKISDVYLDIFNPIHLRAFLMFLRIALWGEFHVYA